MRTAALLLLLAAWACPAAADDRQALLEANRLYESQQFEEAARRYQELTRRHPRSASAHFNLGNALFQMNRLGPSIVSYQRAFDLRPRDGDLRHNLDFALRRAGENLIPTGTPPALFILFHLFSDAELAALHWLGFWLAGLLGAAYLLSGRARVRLRPWLTGTVVFWALAGAWWGARGLTAVPSPGVTVVHTEARSGPSENFPVSFKVPEGRRVSCLGLQEGYVEIGVLKEGLKGWVPVETVERIRLRGTSG